MRCVWSVCGWMCAVCKNVCTVCENMCSVCNLINIWNSNAFDIEFKLWNWSNWDCNSIPNSRICMIPNVEYEIKGSNSNSKPPIPCTKRSLIVVDAYVMDWLALNLNLFNLDFDENVKRKVWHLLWDGGILNYTHCTRAHTNTQNARAHTFRHTTHIQTHTLYKFKIQNFKFNLISIIWFFQTKDLRLNSNSNSIPILCTKRTVRFSTYYPHGRKSWLYTVSSIIKGS